MDLSQKVVSSRYDIARSLPLILSSHSFAIYQKSSTMRRGLKAGNSCDVMALKCWYDLPLAPENARVDEQLTLVAFDSLVQYPLEPSRSTLFTWVGREDMEVELRRVINTHARGLKKLLKKGVVLDSDRRRYVQIGMLPGTSGIGKVRVTLFHFFSVVDWCVLVTPVRHDCRRLEHCMRLALVGRPSSKKRARTRGDPPRGRSSLGSRMRQPCW